MLVIWMMGSLYLWSGASKFGGYFWCWTMPYQFLNFSPVSRLFRRWYLDKELNPTLMLKLIGLAGAVLETMGGVFFYQIL
eukprot:UN28502